MGWLFEMAGGAVGSIRFLVHGVSDNVCERDGSGQIPRLDLEARFL